MVEITHGGLWFRWSLLGRTDKWLAGTSCVAGCLASIPVAFLISELSHEAGRRVAGSHSPDSPGALSLDPIVAWASVGLLAISALLWWRFSVRQDEMFNRIQNWAIGMAGGWIIALLLPWTFLAAAGVLGPPPPLIVFFICLIAPSLFWYAAVHRWAS
ncbi:MAG: hypothetical protein Q8R44_01300 [Novosphingobium sp.]|nr:hypothetical protein [Novosphingobium sp.]